MLSRIDSLKPLPGRDSVNPALTGTSSVSALCNVATLWKIVNVCPRAGPRQTSFAGPLFGISAITDVKRMWLIKGEYEFDWVELTLTECNIVITAFVLLKW